MIKCVCGNIFESKAQALINTVNTKGVMGKGIALQFSQSFPEMFKEYEHECEKGNIVIGKMHVWKNNAMFGPEFIINFPTKKDWKQPSKLEYIIEGLKDLVKVVEDNNIASIAIPPLGCGNGGLDWEIVKKMIIEALGSIPNVKVELYEPNADFILKPKTEEVEMTALFFCTSVYAGSYIKDYSSGKRLYEFDGKYVKSYSTGKRLYQVDGEYIKDYSSGKRLYQYDGKYIKDYSSGKRLLEFDGSYVKEYSSGKRLLEFSGSYVKAYSSGERLMESTGVIPRVIVALIVLQGL